MSVETYYKQGPIRKVENYGETFKLLVSDLLSLDTMLSLDSVITDTVTQYSCYLKISNSRIGFKVSNNYNNVDIIMSYLDSSNNWNVVEDNRVDLLHEQVCVVVWGIGDCIRYFSIDSNYKTGKAIGGSYSFLNSETYKEKIVVENFFGFESSGVVFPNPPTFDALPYKFYNSEEELYQALSLFSFIPNNASTKSGFVYTLQPVIYQAASPTKGFLNITFGEGHKLYRLYNGTEAVTANPGEMVTIDGKQVMSVGPVIYAE